MTNAIARNAPTTLHHAEPTPPTAGNTAPPPNCPPQYSLRTLSAYAGDIAMGALGGVTLPAIYARHYFNSGCKPAAGRAVQIAKGFPEDFYNTWNSEGLQPAVRQAAYAIPTTALAVSTSVMYAVEFGILAGGCAASYPFFGVGPLVGGAYGAWLALREGPDATTHAA